MVQLSHCRVPPRAIARLLDCHPDTVRRWVARAATGAELDDRPRSGRPPVYAEAIQLKTIAFYCQVAPLPGCNTWSLRWAHTYLRTHRAILGAPMSRPTMQRILKRHALRPHLHRYFLTITDPDFFPKMDHIIALYLSPPRVPLQF